MTWDNHLENKQRDSEKNEETPIVDRGPSKNKKDPQFHGTGGPRTPTFQNEWELCVITVSYSLDVYE